MKIIYNAKQEHCEFRGYFPSGLTTDDLKELYDDTSYWAPVSLGNFNTLDEAIEALPDEDSLITKREKSYHGIWFCDSTVAYITEDEYDENGEFSQRLSCPVFRAAPLAPIEDEDEEEN